MRILAQIFYKCHGKKNIYKKTNESRAYRVACWLLVVLEIAVAIFAILSNIPG